MKEEGNADQETRDPKRQRRASYATKQLNVPEPFGATLQPKTIWHQTIAGLKKTKSRYSYCLLEPSRDQQWSKLQKSTRFAPCLSGSRSTSLETLEIENESFKNHYRPNRLRCHQSKCGMTKKKAKSKYSITIF